MSKILLTGGAGYIGSHTAVTLLKEGYDVVIADNLSNSDKQAVSNIEKIAGKSVGFYEIDLCDRDKTFDMFKKENFDAVIHFAGYKAVGESVAKPCMYYRNNIDITLTVLEAMAEYGVKRIIFSSSATVYGPLNPIPYVETMKTGDCTNPYGTTKFMIEKILTDVAAVNPDMSVVLLRYFNPIGADPSGLIGEKPQGIPNNLMPYITQTAKGIREKVTVFGNDYPTVDGSGVRDYIHVVDLAEGHAAALKYAFNNAGVEAINLGSGRGTSVLELINAFERVNNIKVPHVIGPRRDGDIAEFYADATKAKKLLNWETKLSVDDMCRDSWNFEKNQK
ncbi:MAG: UDP-glucose 4-epimerase GalE [Lachnospiraceae bacterium]|nr:UDP-glucose 4-epimerase GalE [Lachnospiraceae bacterium]MBR0434865.1 UDP-glucose 4-epimerase GalE [Lachnospiraceae bacterium]